MVDSTLVANIHIFLVIAMYHKKAFEIARIILKFKILGVNLSLKYDSMLVEMAWNL